MRAGMLLAPCRELVCECDSAFFVFCPYDLDGLDTPELGPYPTHEMASERKTRFSLASPATVPDGVRGGDMVHSLKGAQTLLGNRLRGRSTIVLNRDRDQVDGHVTVVALGLKWADQIRGVALLVFMKVSGMLSRPGDRACRALTVQDEACRVVAHQWPAGRWFVTDDVLGLVGRIQLERGRYRVIHTNDAMSAAYAFGSVDLATTYFDEYALALTLG